MSFFISLITWCSWLH